MGNSKKLSLALAGLILGASLVACDDGRGGAEAAAKQLASAVVGAGRRPGGLRRQGLRRRQRTAAGRLQGPGRRTSPPWKRASCTLDGDTATVPLNYSWKIGSSEWKYTVSAQLRKSGRQMADGLEPGNPGSRTSPTGEILSKGHPVAAAGRHPRCRGRPAGHLPARGERRHRQATAGRRGRRRFRHQAGRTGGRGPAAYAQQVEASGAEAFVPAITLREEGRTITDEQIAAIPGARAIPDTLAAGPQPDLRPGRPWYRGRGQCRTDRSVGRGPDRRRRDRHRRAAAAVRRPAPRHGRRRDPRAAGRPHPRTDPGRRNGSAPGGLRDGSQSPARR